MSVAFVKVARQLEINLILQLDRRVDDVAEEFRQLTRGEQASKIVMIR